MTKKVIFISGNLVKLININEPKNKTNNLNTGLKDCFKSS